MGKYILYALIVVGASSLWNWSALMKGGGSGGYVGTAPRGGYGGGWSSSGSGHK